MKLTGWKITLWGLEAAFVVAAALHFLHWRAGFLTSHLADLTVPATLYILSRELVPGLVFYPRPLGRFIGRTPERAAILLFGASTVTELSQMWWPRGLFRGTYDPLDIVAFGAGLALCYGAEKLSRGRASRSS